MEQLPLRDIDTAGADFGDLLVFDGTDPAWQAPPPISDGKFRGAWAADSIVAVPNFASAMPVELTPGTTGGATLPYWSGSAPVGSPPAGATGYVIMQVADIYSGTQSKVTLSLTALGIPNITRVKVWMAGQSGGNMDQTYLKGYKNGSNVIFVGAQSAWQQFEVAAISTDTLMFCHEGGYGIHAGEGRVTGLTKIEIYATNDPYMLGEYVTYAGRLWQSQVDNNASTPGASANWVPLPLNGAALVTKTTSYTVDASLDEVIVANGATVTITLPDPTLVASRIFRVKNINSASATVNSAGTSKTIDGASSVSLAQWAAGRYISDGTQWLAI